MTKVYMDVSADYGQGISFRYKKNGRTFTLLNEHGDPAQEFPERAMLKSDSHRRLIRIMEAIHIFDSW